MNTRQNVETVKEMYSAFGRGDIPAILSQLANDVEWWIFGSPETPIAGRRYGHAQVGEWFKILAEELEVKVFEPREYISEGDKVVALGYFCSAVRSTGRTSETEWAMVWSFRDGKVTQLLDFTDTAALVAAYQVD